MAQSQERAPALADVDIEKFKSALNERREAIIESLARDDFAQVAELIRQINKIRDDTLYREVGRLTRGLHNALRDFHLDIALGGDATLQNELSEMADARSRLNYVIRMTESAANETMDKVDASVPVLQDLIQESTELGELWSDDDYDPRVVRTRQLLSKVAGQGADINRHLNDILVAQGFQDLSGQVIGRVITLVTDVESALVRLVKLAADVEMVAGIVPAVSDDAQEGQKRGTDKDAGLRGEGPQFRDDKDAQVVSGQDDVDELLSSLGF